METANTSFEKSPQSLAAKVGVTAWGVRNPLVAGAPFEVNVSAKALDGLALGEVHLVVVDETGAEIACALQAQCEPPHAQTCDEAAPAETSAAAAHVPTVISAVIGLRAPQACGPHAWKVEVRRGGEVLASRPVPLSVTPLPSRNVSVLVTDAETGEPLSDASVFFYNDALSRVKPLSSVSDGHGLASALVVADAPYSVRVECLDHDEGTCSIAAGKADEPAEASVCLARSAFAEENLNVVHGSAVRLGR